MKATTDVPADPPGLPDSPDEVLASMGNYVFDAKALIDGGAGIETLAIERPGLHEAFVAIAGDAAAREMDEPEEVVP